MVVAAGAVLGAVDAWASTVAPAPWAGPERPLEVVRAADASAQAYRAAAERRRSTIDALFDRMKTASPSSPSLAVAAVLPGKAEGKAEKSPEKNPEKIAAPSAPQAPQAPQASLPSLPSRHTVQSGETLAAIARRVYGHAGAWELIAAANGITDPSTVTAGRTLTLPPSGTQPAPDRSAGAAPATAGSAGSVVAAAAPPAPPRVRPVVMTDRAPVLNRYHAPSEQSLDYATYEWRVHHVQPGETLSSLAERFLGGAAQAGVLARFNQVAEGSVLPAGSGLLVPQPKRPELHERYLLSTQGIFR